VNRLLDRLYNYPRNSESRSHAGRICTPLLDTDVPPA
jgi:hypothetical protein